MGTTYPELADHIARETGFVVLTFNFRGTGTSEGDFSAAGWLDDLGAAVTALAARDGVRTVWLAGFGHGGTFAVCEAASDDRVRGVATIAAPSTLRDWARDPAHMLAHRARDGHDPDAGLSRRTRRVGCGRSRTSTQSRPRSDSTGARCSCSTGSTIPTFPSTTHAPSPTPGAPLAELRLVQGAGHRLRHDPRAVATLLGWLDRQVP